MQTEKMPIYPVEEWTVTETEFLPENNYRNETTFSLSNGYLGTRGTFEEAYPFDVDTGLEGNFINGFYESENIRYGEASFGFPVHSQSLLNLPNLKETRLYLDGEEFDMRTGKVEEYSRSLHIKDGVLERKLVFTSPSGKKVRLRIRRLVSLEQKNTMAIRYEATPLNFSGELVFVSKLQANVENHTRKTNPIVDYGPFGRKLEPLMQKAEERRLLYRGKTQMSALTMACGSSHRLWAKEEVQETYQVKELEAELTLRVRASEQETVVLEKMISYASDLDLPTEALDGRIMDLLDQAEKDGYEGLEQKQKEILSRFWEAADIVIEGAGSAALRQGIRFNLFHIFQSAGRDGRTGMGAKGLSGEGYEGHYFWDTEMYVLPVLIYTEPDTARALLEYRWRTLPQARQRAKVLGHPCGALFPWRTINGEEASTYFPLGTAQYHINADIEYATALYLQVTGDLDFLREMGAELILDTARIWADVGCFAECRGGKYCICDVTGPDEYNVLVDNNFYTNFMAREHLRDAVKVIKYLKEKDPETIERLKEKLQLRDEEPQLWEKIADEMYFPYDETRGVYPMDDGFLMRKPWDESKIPPEKRAWLYENYHPLFIMRHRMSKQADAILAMYLHSNQFTKEEIRRNYDFYQEVTLHHSSLSTCIFGIVASSIGREEEAYTYFAQSARMDLDDYHNNFYAGIHAANMAGTWQAIVNGFAGLRCFEGRLSFSPSLPEAWESYRFRLRYRSCLLEISVKKEELEFRLVEGAAVTFMVYEQEVSLSKKEPRLLLKRDEGGKNA